MAKKKEFDLQQAHHFFAVENFNRAWDYIDKPTRTPEEEDAMLLLGLSSLWHWAQRSDCTPTNFSIGYWQVARIFALMGQPENARRFGQLCLKAAQSEGVLPFYEAYAYEALARAELVAGNSLKMAEYARTALAVSERIQDEEEKKMVLDDLATLR
jgi:hypothetical protein